MNIMSVYKALKNAAVKRVKRGLTQLMDLGPQSLKKVFTLLPLVVEGFIKSLEVNGV